MDPNNVLKNIWGHQVNVPNGQDVAKNMKYDLTPLMQKVSDAKVAANHYQNNTPARLDLSPLLRKLKEAEVVAAQLQRKAVTGKY